MCARSDSIGGNDMNEGLQDNSKHAEFLTRLNKLDFGP
jgi:hypothetical protein